MANPLPPWQPPLLVPPVDPVFPESPAPNLSGIASNVAKEISKPEGWAMVDGYREEYDADGNGGHSTIIWQGNWSTRLEFRAWVLGYSYPAPDAPKNGIPPATLYMHRIVPHQHP